MKYNIGVIITGDPTRGGAITSEIKFLKTLYEQNEEDSEFYIISVNDIVAKGLAKNPLLKFAKEIITITNEEDMHKLKHFSCLISYPLHSNHFGGLTNYSMVKSYNIISKCTNEYQIPVMIRINDSEIIVKDYRSITLNRMNEDKFMSIDKNKQYCNEFLKIQEWNYKNVYWLANGSREACDWVPETLYDRLKPSFRVTDRDTISNNTIYISDDILFLIRKNYQRLESTLTNDYNNKICYIGFFDTVNTSRAGKFNQLFKENKHSIPFKIFGKGTSILEKLKDKSNIEIEEGFLKGDSDEYFQFLNNHLAYIFIGKGKSEARYIGKTLYDAIVARTPIIVYKKCDSKMIAFDNQEYYFETEDELKAIWLKLQIPEVRERWIKDQTKEIFSKLPDISFKFSTLCQRKPKLFKEIEPLF
jgi:hypothetical protein